MLLPAVPGHACSWSTAAQGRCMRKTEDVRTQILGHPRPELRDIPAIPRLRQYQDVSRLPSGSGSLTSPKYPVQKLYLGLFFRPDLLPLLMRPNRKAGAQDKYHIIATKAAALASTKEWLSGGTFASVSAVRMTFTLPRQKRKRHYRLPTSPPICTSSWWCILQLIEECGGNVVANLMSNEAEDCHWWAFQHSKHFRAHPPKHPSWQLCLHLPPIYLQMQPDIARASDSYSICPLPTPQEERK